MDGLSMHGVPELRTPPLVGVASGCTRNGRRHDEVGAVAVEMALVLPILLLLLMGIIDFSRAYNTKEALQYAVREGARDLALGKDEAVAAETTRARASTASTIDPALVGVTATPCPSPLPPSVPDVGPPVASVTATYSLSYNIPFFSAGAWDLSATGAMRCAG